jgi:hypothetical protein
MRTLAENLDVTRSILQMSKQDLLRYVAVRQEEESWLKACEAVGAIVIRPDADKPKRVFNDKPLERRRAIVLVPSTVTLPESTTLSSVTLEWHKQVLALKEAQKKQETLIGVRTVVPPVWLDNNKTGDWLETSKEYWIESRPAYNATQVTHRTQRAYRGGYCTAAEAKAHLLNIIESDEKRYKKLMSKEKDNVVTDSSQDEYLVDLEIQRTEITDTFAGNNVLRARYISGEAMTLYIYRDDGRAPFQARIQNIGLIPVTTLKELDTARTRVRERPGVRVVRIFNMELHLEAP